MGPSLPAPRFLDRAISLIGLESRQTLWIRIYEHFPSLVSYQTTVQMESFHSRTSVQQVHSDVGGPQIFWYLWIQEHSTNLLNERLVEMFCYAILMRSISDRCLHLNALWSVYDTSVIRLWSIVSLEIALCVAAEPLLQTYETSRKPGTSFESDL